MKKLVYLAVLIGGLFIAHESKAQVRVNINIGAQPLWGPVGYDYVRYYYLPEIDVYYNVATRKYTYLNGRKWVTKSKLPAHYRHVDLYRTYKVVINDPNPWQFHPRHRREYARHVHGTHQVVLRDVHHRKPQVHKKVDPRRRPIDTHRDRRSDRHDRRR